LYFFELVQIAIEGSDGEVTLGADGGWVSIGEMGIVFPMAI
jgi:hypothetical protein